MRVFIGIELTSEVKREISKILKILEKKHWKVKWEKPEKLHITLAFLGELKVSRQTLVCAGSRQANSLPGKSLKLELIKGIIKSSVKEISPFELSFKGLGCFPEYSYPRVIWLGLKGDLQSLAKLQKNIRHELLKLYDLPRGRASNRIVEGLRRPFTSHITLGRIKDCQLRERQEIGRQLSKIKNQRLKSKIFTDCKMLVDQVTIFESKLSREGSKYKKLEEIPLGLNAD